MVHVIGKNTGDNSEIHILTIRLSNLKSIEKKLHQYADQVASYLKKNNPKYKIMKTERITVMIKALSLVVFAILIAGCENGQGMMYGDGRSMNMGNWNWIEILVGIIIGFLLGYFIIKRRR